MISWYQSNNSLLFALCLSDVWILSISRIVLKKTIGELMTGEELILTYIILFSGICSQSEQTKAYSRHLAQE